MTYTIKLRRGTAAEWTATNPVLAVGEPGVETDTNKLKIGNGSSVWTSLSYSVGSGGGGGGGTAVATTATPTATLVATNVQAALAELDTKKETPTAAQSKATAALTAAVQRANHTGTQPSSTISDIVEAVQDIVGAFLQSASPGLTINYDDAGNRLIFTNTGGGGGGSGAGVTEYSSATSYPVGSWVSYLGVAYENVSGAALFGTTPPGTGTAGTLGTITSNVVVAVSAVNSSTPVGAFFTPIAATDVSALTYTLFSSTSIAETVKVWLKPASAAPPVWTTETPDGTFAVGSGVSGQVTISLTTPKAVAAGTTYIAWVWSSNVAGAFQDRLTLGDATPTVTGEITVPAIEFTTANLTGGTRNDQSGVYLPLRITATTGLKPWQRRVYGDLSRALADTIYSPILNLASYALRDENIQSAVLNTSSLTLALSPYRRSDLTLSTNACVVALQNPSPPASGKVFAKRTILLRTPTGTTPGALTWTNLAGASSITAPPAGKFLVFDVEWYDTSAGWVVVGVAT